MTRHRAWHDDDLWCCKFHAAEAEGTLEKCEICGDLYPWSEGVEICDRCLAEIYDAEH